MTARTMWRARRVTLGALLVGLLVTAGSCDSGPKAGDVVFDLQTPNQDDGAIQFRITSTAPATMSAVAAECAGCQVFAEAVSETEIRGVLLGTVVPGPALRVTVSDRSALQAYSATVVAVSDRQYAIRATGGYTLKP
jgi:hypothetical protein